MELPLIKRHVVVRFDPQRRAADKGLKSAVAEVTQHLEAEELRLKLRKRSRRDKDREKFVLAAEALICNLLISAMAAEDAQVIVPLGHTALWGTGRYRSPVYGQHFLDLIGVCERLHFVTKVSRGYRIPNVSRRPTTIRAGASLIARFPVHQLHGPSFRLADEPELLILKSSKDHEGRSAFLDYKETKRTKQWRSQVARLNDWLRQAPIELAGEGVAPLALDREGQPIEPYRRQLRRIFNNGDWQQGGRLFGGFWMTMERDERFRRLRIAGEPTVNVDFSSLFPRLAYVRAGVSQPENDLYDITGDGTYRDGWKTLFNALLFAVRPLKQWPADTRALLPAGLGVKDAVARIKSAHHGIAHKFEKGLGFELLRLESDMLIEIVTALFVRDIPALPLHDSVLTARSHGEIAKAVMEAAFKARTGSPRAFVKLDAGPTDLPNGSRPRDEKDQLSA